MKTVIQTGVKNTATAGDDDEEDDETMVPHVLNPIGNQTKIDLNSPQQLPQS